MADVRLYVQGENLEELFAISIAGMNEILKPGFCEAFNLENNSLIIENLDIESPDKTSLLIDFMSEILTLSHIKRLFNIFGQGNSGILTLA